MKADSSSFLNRLETESRNLENTQAADMKTTGKKSLHTQIQGVLTCSLLTARKGVRGQAVSADNCYPSMNKGPGTRRSPQGYVEQMLLLL